MFDAHALQPALDAPRFHSALTDDEVALIRTLDQPASKAAPKMYSRRWHVINAVRFIDPLVLADEPRLAQTKWPEYRELDPQRANMKFAEAYAEACRDYYDRYIDRATVGKVKGLDLMTISNPRVQSGQRGKGASHLTAINNARQVADQFGLPYDVFISFCMEFSARRALPKFAPRPNQLVPSKESRRIIFGEKLAAHVIDMNEGPLAFSRISPDMTKPAGCFGVPGARDDQSGTCQACPFAPKCQTTCVAILAELDKMKMDNNEPQTHADKKASVKKIRQAQNTAYQSQKRKAKLAAAVVAACPATPVCNYTPSRQRSNLTQKECVSL